MIELTTQAPPPVAGLAVRDDGKDLATLTEIERRVLWLATRMIDEANRGRDAGGIKVGGHQASCASMVSIMTALWFHHLGPRDLVSVKPHAGPVLHAIHYLLGNLDSSYLGRLRSLGGLQAYPSRTKDPDPVDFSTGSVGLGAAAPLFSALARRYVDAHFGERGSSRFISLLGDAELDEGNVWEAVADPATQGLGSVMWVVDFNRQSLDRVVPGVRIDQWSAQFKAAGWHVTTLKYGSRLRAAFRDGGDDLRQWIDSMSNEQYQSLFALEGSVFRERFLDGAPDNVQRVCGEYADDALRELATNLGGHDLEDLVRAFRECDQADDRPSVVFAYTVKGWRLPTAGNARNHGALLTHEQVAQLRLDTGLDEQTEWDRLAPGSPAGKLVHARSEHLRRPASSHVVESTIDVPDAVGAASTSRDTSSQEAFGRVLTSLARRDDLRPLLVSTAPDVSTTTNLAGFVNKVGVFSPEARRAWAEDSMLKWDETPSGQHIELGISEMNFFLLLGALGLSSAHSDQPLVPIGTVYDPFVLRGLDALIHSSYSGARYLFAGTPSGVTLAPEGGAHQSSITPSVGIELPGVVLLEPAYGQAVDWLTCDAVRRCLEATSEERVHYLRLTTRPIPQTPFELARRRLGDTVLRRQVLAGAYRLLDADDLVRSGAPRVNLAASGALLPEVLAAAEVLQFEGVAAHVVDVTSPSRLYRSWRRSILDSVRRAADRDLPGPLHRPFAPDAPVVTVHDASPHALAWLGSALGVSAVSLGVDEFGQSGTIDEMYELHDMAPGAIVNAALSLIA